MAGKEDMSARAEAICTKKGSKVGRIRTQIGCVLGDKKKGSEKAGKETTDQPNRSTVRL